MQKEAGTAIPVKPCTQAMEIWMQPFRVIVMESGSFRV